MIRKRKEFGRILKEIQCFPVFGNTTFQHVFSRQKLPIYGTDFILLLDALLYSDLKLRMKKKSQKFNVAFVRAKKYKNIVLPKTGKHCNSS